MRWPLVGVGIALLFILGVPFALRPRAERDDREAADSVVVVTPHVQQIRYEFSIAFDRWHLARFGRRARIDWRVPGGTTEIVRQLDAQFTAAAAAGAFDFSDPSDPRCPPGTIGYDAMLGGGSYDHTRVKNGIRVRTAAGEARIPMSQPAGFPQAQLDAWFGENRIGAQILYDADQYWLGTAVSGFGIVYNREIIAQLGLREPRSFEDLADPRYDGWVVLADPRQSGAIATAFESVLNSRGWDDGWRILRSMCANTKSFSNSSTKPPIDVGQGDAAAGLAIDFYGRGQAQVVGDTRVGYVDPPGEVYIDADPASIIRGGPNPELARRFVEFCLTEDAQALWQFDPTQPGAAGTPRGPEQYALRRLPIRRVMYEKYLDRFVDRVNPFEIAGAYPARGWRSAIGPMMGAFAIDNTDEQRAAWRALNVAAARAPQGAPEIDALRRIFFSWPEVTMPDGTRVAFSEQTLRSITDAWRKDAAFAARSRLEISTFFRTQYRRVVRLAESGAGS